MGTCDRLRHDLKLMWPYLLVFLAALAVDTIPIFVRAGSILPLGAPIESTEEKQAISEVRVYPGANGEFTLYNDDGKSYTYEQGKSEVTHLRWDDARGRLEHTGATAWRASRCGASGAKACCR